MTMKPPLIERHIHKGRDRTVIVRVGFVRDIESPHRRVKQCCANSISTRGKCRNRNKFSPIWAFAVEKRSVKRLSAASESIMVNM